MFRPQNESFIALSEPRSGVIKCRAMNMKKPIANMPYTPISAPWA